MNTPTVTGYCYCGGVRFTVNTKEQGVNSYCHCQSCRRAHSAPMYQSCFVPVSSFQIVKGKELIKEYAATPEKINTRGFCSNCGSRIYAKLKNFMSDRIGFYPALLEEHVQHNLPAAFKPQLHNRCKEAVLNLEALADGLPRIEGEDFSQKKEWFEQNSSSV